MDLSELETIAGELAGKRTRATDLEKELNDVIGELRVLPKKASREARFAKLAGIPSQLPEKVAGLEKRQGELAKEREEVTVAIEELVHRLQEGFSSEELTVPLAFEAKKVGNFWTFGYRDGATFPHAVDFLGKRLGLGAVLAIEGVLIEPSGVRVPFERGMEETVAMDKVVHAFEQVRNTIALKMPKEAAKGGW